MFYLYAYQHNVEHSFVGKKTCFLAMHLHCCHRNACDPCIKSAIERTYRCFFFHFLFLVVVAPCVRRESTLRPLNRIPTFVIILINMKRLKRVFSKTRLPNSQRRPPSMRLHLQKVSSVQIMIHPIICRNDYNFSLFCFLLKEKKKKNTRAKSIKNSNR